MKHGQQGTAILVSYYAPPAVGIAAQRLTAFARYLPEFGWRPVVVAPRAVHFHRDEGSEAALGRTEVVRTRNPEPSRWFRTAAGATSSAEEGMTQVTPAETGGLGRLLRRAVREVLYVPDAQALWIPFAARAVVDIAEQAASGPVVVHSSSVPYSAHFAAQRGARARGLPWVAEYRDPWSVSPPQMGERSRWRQLLDGRLDEGVVRNAQAVVTTSETTARLFEESFPPGARGGIHVVRNGFDADSAVQPPGPDEPLKLVYSGTLLHTDYAKDLVQALSRMEATSPGQACLHVFGPPAPWREIVDAEAPHVRLHGLVPAREMPDKLAAASALVLLQPDPAHAQYVAGKLYEYLGSRRPVLASLPPGCEAEGLIRAHGELRSLGSSGLDGVESALRELLDDHRGGRLAGPAVPEERVAPLSRRAQTERLAAVFDSVGRDR